MYEFLPVATIPKSLTREKAKEIMLHVNRQASLLYKKHIRQLNEQIEYEPLLIETLAFDLASIDYGVHENIFRFATHKYQL